jgi:hypothetical protein
MVVVYVVATAMFDLISYTAFHIAFYMQLAIRSVACCQRLLITDQKYLRSLDTLMLLLQGILSQKTVLTGLSILFAVIGLAFAVVSVESLIEFLQMEPPQEIELMPVL